VPDGRPDQGGARTSWRTPFALRKAADDYRRRAARTSDERTKAALRMLAGNFEELARQLDEETAARARTLLRRQS
jgi:hypothetical protein